MIAISVKPVSEALLCEIKEKAEGYTPFYREYILSPISEKNGEMQRIHAAARLANVEFLSRFCKYKFAKMPKFVLGDSQKPYFEGEYRELSFSFSHSGALAVCALSLDGLDGLAASCAVGEGVLCDGAPSLTEPKEVGEGGLCLILDGAAREIGVDVQFARECDIPLTYHHEKIGERFFSQNDYIALTKTPTEDNFYRLWTKTESLAKMTGEGIARYKKRGKENARTHTYTLTCHGARYYLSVSHFEN